MNALKQLLQWPPTSTNVIGFGLMAGLGCYMWTGSVELAVFAAGVFKIVCPQDAPATDQLLNALDKIPSVVPRRVSAVIAMLAIGALLALGACSGGAKNEGVKLSGDAATATAAVLPADQVMQLQQTCAAAAAALAAATAPGAPKNVAGTAVYPAAYCRQLAAGPLPPTTDSGTPSWLPTALLVTQGLAHAAGYILPAVLPLLAAAL